jgi:hypothetical protein
MSEEHVLIRSERILQSILEEVRAIRREVAPHNWSLKLALYTGDDMSSAVLPITSMPLGGNAQLVVQLLENGAPYVPPSGAAPFTFSPSVTSDDADITVAPATVDVSAGAVPLAQQFVLTDAAGDTVGVPDDITVTGTAPDGSTVTETVAFSIGPASPTNTFGLSLAFYPTPGSAPAGVKRTQAEIDAANRTAATKASR